MNLGYRPSHATRRHWSALLLSLSIASGAWLGLAAQTARAALTVTVAPDDDAQPTISVANAGQKITLAQVRDALASTPNAGLLTNSGTVWTLRANLVVKRDATLSLTPADGVTELRLRSEPSTTAFAEACGSAPRPACDYDSFVYLRTNDGKIVIAGTGAANRVKITSWDGAGPDTDYANGRAYLLAKYNARLDISYADVGYLGSADGESYGVAWRDIDPETDQDPLTATNTRVTGAVSNSLFHHNYYGIYTFQAANMSFVGNQFFRNVQYGFDPHDFTHDVVVRDNQAYENGSHGFIISRGCTGFLFENNTSYNNNNVLDPDKLAHGFMLDPGSPSSTAGPQAPSTNNVLRNNEAYGNEGYGLRMLGSNNNTISANNFHDNLIGITVEEGSTGNVVSGNTLANNRNHGLFVRGTADNTTVADNVVAGNAAIGIYVKSNNNTISGNQVRDSRTGDGISVLPETTTAQAILDLLPPGGMAAAEQTSPDAVGSVVAQATLDGNTIRDNTVDDNALYGIELKSAGGTLIQANTITGNGNDGIYLTEGAIDNDVVRNVVHANRKYGIKINGVTSTGNTLTENQAYNNTSGGIAVTQGANGGIKAPTIVSFQNRQVVGTAPVGARVELFSDDLGQGRFFEGSTTADSAGNWSFTKTTNFGGTAITATATDAAGNSSGFGVDVPYAGNELRLWLPLVVQ